MLLYAEAAGGTTMMHCSLSLSLWTYISITLLQLCNFVSSLSCSLCLSPLSSLSQSSFCRCLWLQICHSYSTLIIINIILIHLIIVTIIINWCCYHCCCCLTAPLHQWIFLSLSPSSDSAWIQLCIQLFLVSLSPPSPMSLISTQPEVSSCKREFLHKRVKERPVKEKPTSSTWWNCWDFLCNTVRSWPHSIKWYTYTQTHEFSGVKTQWGLLQVTQKGNRLWVKLCAAANNSSVISHLFL